MSIGYACLCVGVIETNMKSCKIINADHGKLYEITSHNLNSLEKIIDYNIENNIKLFRISSDIIPFGSNPVNDTDWRKDFKDRFRTIGNKIKESGMRVSMHPGQYTVLNSTDEAVVLRAILDLEYHVDFLDCLDLDATHKIVLHIGGVYNDKASGILRFIDNYNKLAKKIKSRLVIENDDRSYNICDVLKISRTIKTPVIFDNLHNLINPCENKEDDFYWINLCSQSWGLNDGPQKIHYSKQDNIKKRGAHSESIRISEFLDFYKNIDKNIDIMLEVKDKNLSAIKCINATTSEKKIKNLEIEWSKYKYNVLENAPNIYKEIRILLKNKSKYPVVEFYNLLEKALSEKADPGNVINSAQHVWGYFSNKATPQEKGSFLLKIQDFEKGDSSIKAIKNYLWRLTLKYNEEYLKNSYYFFINK